MTTLRFAATRFVAAYALLRAQRAYKKAPLRGLPTNTFRVLFAFLTCLALGSRVLIPLVGTWLDKRFVGRHWVGAAFKKLLWHRTTLPNSLSDVALVVPRVAR